MKQAALNRIRKVVGSFRKKKILIIGDLILDEFIWGDVSRISPEAPVPVVWVKRESFMPGGSCNVANNISALGGKAYLAGLIGNDMMAAVLRQELERSGIDTSGVISDDGRPTTVKTRIVAQHQQVVRIDRERIEPIHDSLLERVVDQVKKVLKEIDAVIIEDYGKGVITPRLLKQIVPLARSLKKIIAVDPKEEHFRYYRGISLITPNLIEASRAVKFTIESDADLDRAGKKILSMLQCDTALVTMGEKGIRVFQKGRAPKQIPTVAQEVYDVSGAGDTIIGTFTLALSSGAGTIEAARIANCAAGIVVGKLGTAVVTPDELIDKIRWS